MRHLLDSWTSPDLWTALVGRVYVRAMAANLAERARELAGQLMADHTERLSHLAGVAARSASLGSGLPDDQLDTLVAAAWLHDIGYLPALRRSGFHPLDGALYLNERDWPLDVCALVAHHSGSRFVAAVRGIDEQLRAFSFAENPASDVLTVADNTTRQDGSPVSVTERLQEKMTRHGPTSPGAMANPERDDYIRAATRRVAERISSVGRSDAFLC